MSPNAVESLSTICTQMINNTWYNKYPFLNRQTAGRHIIAFSRMNEIPNVCETIDKYYREKMRETDNYRFFRHMIWTKGAQVDSLSESYLSIPMVSNIRYPCSYVKTNQTMWQRASKTNRPYMYDCIESDSYEVCNQFAQLMAYQLGHSRAFSSAASVYLEATPAKMNLAMLNISLNKTCNRIRQVANNGRL